MKKKKKKNKIYRKLALNIMLKKRHIDFLKESKIY